MDNEKKWHVVYTLPNWEKGTAQLLLKKNIESFCPLGEQEGSTGWSIKPKKPLFKCHVFVYACEKEYKTILQTDGVINFAYWLGKPAVIKQEELDVIKHYLGGMYNLKVEKIPVNMDGSVVITTGVVEQFQDKGIMYKHSAKRITLPSLGFAILAVGKLNVQITKPVANIKYL